MGEGILYLVTSFWLGAGPCGDPGAWEDDWASVHRRRARSPRRRACPRHSSSLCRTRAGLSWSPSSRPSAPHGLSLDELRHISPLAPGSSSSGLAAGCCERRCASCRQQRSRGYRTIAHSHDHGPHYHSHGWGVTYTHDIDAITQVRPNLAILLGLGHRAVGCCPTRGLGHPAGGDRQRETRLGLLTVLVFSLGVRIGPRRRRRGRGTRRTAHP